LCRQTQKSRAIHAPAAPNCASPNEYRDIRFLNAEYPNTECLI
jgi:hypothetical protein